jgi:hypothetical protein
MSNMNTLFDIKPDVNIGAEFSPCGNYRYKLWRIWDENKPLAMCIGLNPSTANGTKNDQTISYLIKMLTILGYGGFYMTNLFAIISSKPEILLTHPDPVGENDYKLMEVKSFCRDVIVCWGGFKQAEERIKVVLPKFPNSLCFGVSANGKPFHPLAMMPRNGRDPNNPSLTFYNAHNRS